MNWGYKILIVIIAFMIAILSMVFVAFRQTNDMLDENYYEKEMNYQSLIDAAQNLNLVNDSLLINQNESYVIVHVPITLISNFEQGNLTFLRIDDKRKDFTFDFKPNEEGILQIEKFKFIPGTYKARMKWRNLGKDYYREQNLIVE
ncbi:MAG TPA: FixH family protein [Saprospiraceae bacterium]|nr:FixH family protein [Saprospiraceae bacterium]